MKTYDTFPESADALGGGVELVPRIMEALGISSPEAWDLCMYPDEAATVLDGAAFLRLCALLDVEVADSSTRAIASFTGMSTREAFVRAVGEDALAAERLEETSEEIGWEIAMLLQDTPVALELCVDLLIDLHCLAEEQRSADP